MFQNLNILENNTEYHETEAIPIIKITRYSEYDIYAFTMHKYKFFGLVDRAKSRFFHCHSILFLWVFW